MADTDESMRQRVLNWELRKELDGRTDSVLLMALYTVSLYAKAQHSAEPDHSRWMKLAVTEYLRTFGTILTEGGQCKDPMSAESRLSSLGQSMLPIQRVLKGYSQPAREAVTRDSFLLMQVSFPDRYPDEWLCDGAFRPYVLWGEGRVVALRAVEKGLLLPSPIPIVPVPKNPKIIPLYG